MRRLDNITDSIDMGEQTPGDRGAWHAAVCVTAKCQTEMSD